MQTAFAFPFIRLFAERWVGRFLLYSKLNMATVGEANATSERGSYEVTTTHKSQRNDSEMQVVTPHPMTSSVFFTPEDDTAERDSYQVLRTRMQVVTPHQMTASVFTTPPTSGIKAENKTVTMTQRAVEEQIPKLNLETSDDAEVQDVISILVTKNAYELLKNILKYLSPMDLCQFSAVCRSWRFALEQDPKARQRKKRFLTSKLATNQQENSMTLLNAKFPKSMELSRKALVSTKNQPNLTRTSNTSESDRKSNYPFGIYGKHRPCPKCWSPARESPTTGRCSRCDHSFCILCFKPYSIHHKCPTPEEGVVSHQRDGGTNSMYAVGSKHSKKRLKRL